MKLNSKRSRPSRIGVVLGTILGAGIFVAACGTTEPQEEVVTQPTDQEIQDATRLAPSVPLAVSVNALMVALVDHGSHEIWDVAETPPESDTDWEQLEYHAIQLAAAGTMISMGGTGPADAGWVASPDWQRFAQQIADTGTRAIDAVRSRSVGELNSIGDSLVETCEACHTEFKPDLPTEGLAHTPHYQH